MQAVEAAFKRNTKSRRAAIGQRLTFDRLRNFCAAVFNRNADGTPDLIRSGYSGKPVEIAVLRYASSDTNTTGLMPSQGFSVSPIHSLQS